MCNFHEAALHDIVKRSPVARCPPSIHSRFELPYFRLRGTAQLHSGDELVVGIDEMAPRLCHAMKEVAAGVGGPDRIGRDENEPTRPGRSDRFPERFARIGNVLERVDRDYGVEECVAEVQTHRVGLVEGDLRKWKRLAVALVLFFQQLQEFAVIKRAVIDDVGARPRHSSSLRFGEQPRKLVPLEVRKQEEPSSDGAGRSASA